MNSSRAEGDPGRVAFVVGTTAGGTGAHVAMLAAGCAARGMAVSVFGPSQAAAASGLGSLPGVPFTPVEFGDRPRPGDAGANALGAMLGCAAAVSLPRPARVALLAGIAALTVASEKVSFTKVIERTPPLRWLDMLGRRPQAPAPQAAPQAASQVPPRQTEP